MATVIVAGEPGGFTAICLSCLDNGGGALYLTDGPVNRDVADRVAVRHRGEHETAAEVPAPGCSCPCTCGGAR